MTAAPTPRPLPDEGRCTDVLLERCAHPLGHPGPHWNGEEGDAASVWAYGPDGEAVTEPAAPTPAAQNTIQIVLTADGVVGQGTSPWPVEENKDHL